MVILGNKILETAAVVVGSPRDHATVVFTAGWVPHAFAQRT